MKLYSHPNGSRSSSRSASVISNMITPLIYNSPNVNTNIPRVNNHILPMDLCISDDPNISPQSQLDPSSIGSDDTDDINLPSYTIDTIDKLYTYFTHLPLSTSLYTEEELEMEINSMKDFSLHWSRVVCYHIHSLIQSRKTKFPRIFFSFLQIVWVLF